MNRTFKLLSCMSVFAAVLAPASLTGCSGTTDRGVRYTLTPSRELEAFIAGDVATVHEAARRVLGEQYRYRVTKHIADAREGTVEALTARGDEVRVETTYSSPRVTRVNVFVGPLGDEPIMRELLGAIEDRARLLTQRNEAVSKAQQAPKPATSKPAPTTAAPAKPSSTTTPVPAAKPATATTSPAPKPTTPTSTPPTTQPK